MKKAPEAFRTISEVSDLLDTPAHVLRFWESKFYQIRPVKRAGGRRYYRPDDLALLAGIRLLLQDQGMTIRGVQKVLQDQGVRHVASLAPDLALLDSLEDEAQGGAADEAVRTGANTPGAPAPRSSAPRPPAPLPLGDPDTVSLPVTGPAAAERPAGARAPEPPAPQVEASDTVATGSSAVRPEYEPDTIGAPETDDAGTAGPALPGAPPRRSDGAFPDAGDDGTDDDDEPRAADLPPARPRPPVPPAPDLSDRALALGDAGENERIAQLLRHASRDRLAPHRDKAELLARRIDALLDRMSDASGAGRW